MVGSIFFQAVCGLQRAKKKINITVLSRPVCVFEKMSAQISENSKEVVLWGGKFEENTYMYCIVTVLPWSTKTQTHTVLQ